MKWRKSKRTVVRSMRSARPAGGDEDIRIDRCTKWGNPFRIGPDGTREEVVAKYAKYLEGREDLVSELPSLKGKTLWCWCAPLLCHGDVLACAADFGLAAAVKKFTNVR